MFVYTVSGQVVSNYHSGTASDVVDSESGT